MSVKNRVNNSNIKDYHLKEDHIPVIRISKIKIDGLKSVHHGEVILECGKQYIPHGTQSDMLGIYGQNGSGKTTLIEALAILSCAMQGRAIKPKYAELISVDADISNLFFEFDFQYPNGERRIVEYSFSIKKVALSEEELREAIESRYSEKPLEADDFNDETAKYKVQICNETIKMSQIQNGKKSRLQTIIDTGCTSLPFGPQKRINEWFSAKDKEAKIRLELNRENAYKTSKSFIFDSDTINILSGIHMPDNCLETISALHYFADKCLFVVGTRTYAMIGLSLLFPTFTADSQFVGPLHPGKITEEQYGVLTRIYSNLSTVLSQIIPGLSVDLKIISDTTTKDNKRGYMVMPIARRDKKEIPLRDESDGVKKIISILGLIIAAYNDESITVAIDELDAGIFEYLLGEILQLFEESGKGQLIFTSHNLRPLEVIDKRFLVFTTTNENNRYYRFKDIASTNNLRDRYFREILLGEQEETLYDRTKRYKIEMAMKEAGEE